GDFIATWLRVANPWISLSERFYAHANALPNLRHTLHQLLALSGQRRNRKEDDCSSDNNKRKHQEDHTRKTRNVMLLQPDDDRVKNHGEEKNDREEQDHRLKRAQDQPRHNKQKDQPDNVPSAAVTQRRILILVIAFSHEMRIVWHGTCHPELLLRIGANKPLEAPGINTEG